MPMNSLINIFAKKKKKKRCSAANQKNFLCLWHTLEMCIYAVAGEAESSTWRLVKKSPKNNRKGSVKLYTLSHRDTKIKEKFNIKNGKREKH